MLLWSSSTSPGASPPTPLLPKAPSSLYAVPPPSYNVPQLSTKFNPQAGLDIRDATAFKGQ